MADKSFNFTKEAIAKIVPPKEDRDTYKDTKEPGLILIVSYTGARGFYIAKNIKTASGKKYYRKKIGDFPDLSVAEARAKVAELKTQIAKGFNPYEQLPEEPEEITFKQLLDRYIAEYAQAKIKRWKYIANDMDRQAQDFYDLRISSIQKAEIQKVFNDISSNTGQVTANRFVERMRSIFNRAIDWELIDKNPAVGIKKHKEKARDRYITAEEKEKFLQAVYEESSSVMRDFIFIALLTGARKSNVLSMHWGDISFKNKIWRIPDTKNGEPHNVALSEYAIMILEERAKDQDSEWVFTSKSSSSGHLQEPKKAWRRICQRAELEDLRIHDLRRTRGSWLAIAGASQYIISKALNHKSPSSTQIYVRLSLDPVREYMEKADNLFNTVKKKEENAAS